VLQARFVKISAQIDF